METQKTLLSVKSSSSFKESIKVAARLWKGGQSLAPQFYVKMKGKDMVATLCVLYLTWLDI